MSITNQELLNYLNSLMNPQFFDDYGPNGLQVEGQTSIKKIAFAVSATQDSLQQAIEWGAQAMIVHHGILWKYQVARPITGAWGERIKLCIKQDLNLYAYHLPLDSNPEFGNAVSLAQEIGLTQLSPFGIYKKQPLGTKGVFVTPLSAKDFKTKLSLILNRPVLLASHDEYSTIKSLGIITGGANNEWVKAMEDGLDAYLTGEISEYNWHDAKEAKIHYFAGGHHATEKFGIQALMKKIKNDFNQLEVQFFDSANPV